MPTSDTDVNGTWTSWSKYVLKTIESLLEDKKTLTALINKLSLAVAALTQLVDHMSKQIAELEERVHEIENKISKLESESRINESQQQQQTQTQVQSIGKKQLIGGGAGLIGVVYLLIELVKYLIEEIVKKSAI